MTPEPNEIALRPDEDGLLDDVVVPNVDMFRAEMMDGRNLWMACYLPGGERLAFNVHAHSRKGLIFTVTEFPAGDWPYEEGSIDSPHWTVPEPADSTAQGQ